jgi:hypothetical protein
MDIDGYFVSLEINSRYHSNSSNAASGYSSLLIIYTVVNSSRDSLT